MRFVDVAFLSGSVVIFAVSIFALVKVINYRFISKDDNLSKEMLNGSLKFSICIAVVGIFLVSGLFSFLGLYDLISK